MKVATFLALISTSSAIRLAYDQSEGPTKADNGENDDKVLHASTIDGNKGHKKWVNPLSVHDDGADDDRVLAQILLQQRAEHVPVMPDPKFGHLFNVHNDWEMGRFNQPYYFTSDVEDIFNTHHGDIPHPGPRGYNDFDLEPKGQDLQFYHGHPQ